eukprot:gene18639-25154_t
MMQRLLDVSQRKFAPNPIPGDCPPTPPIPFPIAVYSHRGGWLERDGSGCHYVENTMPAFRNSATLDVDVLELDVHLTKDDQVVVFHDKDMARMCGRQYRGKSIKDFNYDDLPPLLDKQADAAGPADKEAGPADKDRTRIFKLEELFIEFPTFPIQIDFKANSEKLVHLTHELIMKYPGRQQLVIWGSFLHNVNSCAYKVDRSIPLSASFFRMLLLMTAHRFGLMESYPIYESFFIAHWVLWPFGLGLESGGGRRTCAQWKVTQFVEAGHFTLIVLFGDERRHASINNLDAYKACHSSVCHAICTDAPSLLQKFLSEVGPLPRVQMNVTILTK